MPLEVLPTECFGRYFDESVLISTIHSCILVRGLITFVLEHTRA